ncbi:MAG TPA: pyridoxal-phosphate dependent enzyme [Myxococcales bacterium LLY-WYZ-16_1]|nr:pyridoxal-phosphate dependent enzyme [Myxococcales bacterium LLY-WYZ-16_1]
MFEANLPPRVTLAHTPTPFEGLPRLGEELGLALWAKRDDLTGAALSGNKVRKLEFLLADALSQGATCVATCGGVNSNHARATAVGARRLGMAPHLILRGNPAPVPVGNLFLDRWVGAEVEFIPPEAWPRVDELLAAWAERQRDAGEVPYVIPEGGSNGLGLLGYVHGCQELLQDEARCDTRLGAVVHAVGSGGTTAGLAAGLALAGRDDVRVVGVAVCDDARTFDAKIRRILEEAAAAGYLPDAAVDRCRWEIAEGFVGPGYAKTDRSLLESHRQAALTEGLVVDPVYTGKALDALVRRPDLGAEGDAATVFLHTGGIFELFAYAETAQGVLGSARSPS